jgi:hypothetical protein
MHGPEYCLLIEYGTVLRSKLGVASHEQMDSSFTSARIIIPEMPCIRQTEPSIPTPGTNQRSRFLRAEEWHRETNSQLTTHMIFHGGTADATYQTSIFICPIYWLSAFRETSNHNLACKADHLPHARLDVNGGKSGVTQERDKGELHALPPQKHSLVDRLRRFPGSCSDVLVNCTATCPK